jgi:cytochrome P450
MAIAAPATAQHDEMPAPGDERELGAQASASAGAREIRIGVPPGPRAPALLQTLVWALAPTWLMDQCAQRLGESFTLTLWPSGMQLVLVSGREAVKKIFTAPPELAPSAAGNSPIRPVMGPNSVIVLTGQEHIRQRKLLLPPFHGERMREYEQTIVDATRADMASWRRGEPMSLQERTRAITLEVILRAVFGVEAERMDSMREAIASLLEPMKPWRMVLLALRRTMIGTPPGAIGKGLARLDGVIYEELARRREQQDLTERTDILSLLLQARDEQGEPMTDVELRDELVTLLLAGHETTATSVAWAIERLVRHPQALARLQAEIDGQGDGAQEGAAGSYMTAVVNETLRVRPVLPVVARMLTGELELDGFRMPAGTRVMPSIYLTNRNPRTYERPTEFRPERFLGEVPDTFAWIPFGGGTRRCIGASFAQLEMRLMLRTMLSELQPSVPLAGRGRRGSEWNRRRAITLIPSAGARVVWRERQATV